MIFLSHNSKDKPVIEQIAVALRNAFGQDKVFYDSWSIQPGDGIIDKMNQGMAECRFFFFFISVNSIRSNMVKLEWQNALMRATNGQCKMIPVRLDGTLIPALLQQTLYLDLFTNGLDITLRQMCDVIVGKDSFTSPQSFSNLEAQVLKVIVTLLNIYQHKYL
jgi:hypothetical protein